jgi:hypothetical protein
MVSALHALASRKNPARNAPAEFHSPFMLED